MSEQKYTRRPLIDPAVADLLAGMEHKQSISQLPRKKREKYAREHAKIEARRDQRVTYDLPKLLKDKIREMAEEHNLPASQLAALALIRFLDDMSRGRIDLESMKEPSRSPRYDWNLNLPAGPIYIENIRDKR